MTCFNSRPRAGAIPTVRQLACTLDSFNSRPRAGAILILDHSLKRHNCFNSRPRAGAIGHRAGADGADQVSIHAPARGRSLSGKIAAPASPFQFTPPRGGDHAGDHQPRARFAVSIHAPARGRSKRLEAKLKSLEFQFTPPRGGDRSSPVFSGLDTLFQFTPPRGGDPAYPRKHGGRSGVSIHAPARGRS